MLVLSRQLDESIMIGDEIIVTIVDIKGDKVRIGIAAPGDVPVHRQEVFETIQRETFEAAYAESQVAEDSGPTTARPFNPRSLSDLAGNN
ncbi:Carbon storage regulator [Planctomycetes bacterium Pan216]|uniref:Translational regulator CsrA n=1 Tax=Kolteria novifilia TaxID=2527975 RepID=A0A518AXU5_9BACT|nr:Carbon storage regulator [Planctomycetes bacterium Pan216]